MLLATKKKAAMRYSLPQKTLRKLENENVSPMTLPMLEIKETDNFIFDDIEEEENEGGEEQDGKEIRDKEDGDDNGDGDIIVQSLSKLKDKFFCTTCQVQFKANNELNQHKKTQKHLKAVNSYEVKFTVAEESILNKDYDNLISEKGWLSDAVKYALSF